MYITILFYAAAFVERGKCVVITEAVAVLLLAYLCLMFAFVSVTGTHSHV